MLYPKILNDTPYRYVAHFKGFIKINVAQTIYMITSFLLSRSEKFILTLFSLFSRFEFLVVVPVDSVLLTLTLVNFVLFLLMWFA